MSKKDKIENIRRMAAEGHSPPKICPERTRRAMRIILGHYDTSELEQMRDHITNLINQKVQP